VLSSYRRLQHITGISGQFERCGKGTKIVFMKNSYAAEEWE